MNDYDRTVDIVGRRIAPLNGETAVYSNLQTRWDYCGGDPSNLPVKRRPWDIKRYFNITEDWNKDDHDKEAPKPPLLYTPSPQISRSLTKMV